MTQILFIEINGVVQVVPPVTIVHRNESVLFRSMAGPMQLFLPTGGATPLDFPPKISSRPVEKLTWEVPENLAEGRHDYGAYSVDYRTWAVGASPPRIIVAPPVGTEPTQRTSPE